MFYVFNPWFTGRSVKIEYPRVELTEWIVTKQKYVERSQVGECKRL